ncbi:MAG: hypothetical protein AB1486_26635 [Planctomycetota bacterium]
MLPKLLPVLLAALLSASPDQAPSDFSCTVVPAREVAASKFPTEPPDLNRLANDYQPLAAELGLGAYLCTSPPVVLFGPDASPDGRWMLYIVSRAVQAFRETLQLQASRESPIALVWVDDASQWEAVIDWLAAKESYLAGWSSGARNLNGFAIYRPLLAGVLEGPSSGMGRNLENNLLHLTGHLLLYQYFGFQPFWVREGIALDLEASILGTLYSFCAGDRFVPVTRRDAWRRDIRSYWRRQQGLDLDLLTSLSQEAFDQEGALLALSLVRHLKYERPEEFLGLLKSIRSESRKQSREERYNLSPEKQKELLLAALGEEWEQQALAACQGRAPASLVAAEEAWLVPSRVASTTEPAKEDAAARVEIEWQGKRQRLASLPAEIANQAADSLDLWAPWCARIGYHALLNRQGTVLLLVANTESRAASLLEEVESVCRLLEGGFLDEHAAAATTPTGKAASSPPHACATLIECRAEPHYRGALELIRQEYPLLSRQLAGLDEASGFLLSNPLVGSWLKLPAGVEEWRPEHELINRLTQLLIMRRFGRPPFWLLIGSAWYAEFELKRQIYSFPYRSGFVAVGEHAGWASDLERRFSGKEARTLTIDRLAGIAPGTYAAPDAGLCWGVVTFLAKRHPAALAGILADCAAYTMAHRHGGSRPDSGDVPPSVQLEILQKHAGTDCLQKAEESFRNGCK